MAAESPVSQSDVDERLHRIEQAVGEIVKLARAEPPARLHEDPAPEGWSLMHVLAHTAELLPYWSNQAMDLSRRTEDNLPFGRTHDDPDRIKAVEDHAGDTLDRMLPMVQESLAHCVATLRSIPLEGWQHTGRHSRRGEMSVGQLVDSFLVEHLEEHLEQARGVVKSLGAR